MNPSKVKFSKHIYIFKCESLLWCSVKYAFIVQPLRTDTTLPFVWFLQRILCPAD